MKKQWVPAGVAIAMSLLGVLCAWGNTVGSSAGRRFDLRTLTCAQFRALDFAQRNEIAAFASGYLLGSEAREAPVYDAEYTSDAAEILLPCSGTPDAHFWEKIRNLLPS